MTTYFREDVTCSQCGQQSQHQVLGSTNSFGSSDLDLRPPEMQRSTMRAWLQECPGCGYVAPTLSQAATTPAVLATPEYRDLLADETFPELAQRFLLYGLLQAPTNAESAGAANLRAAWVCDDSGLNELAALCRGRVIVQFERCKPFDSDEKGITLGAILVDVLRRAGRFAEAGTECQTLLGYPNLPEILRQVLEFQQSGIARGDLARHTVQEAIPDGA